MVLLGAAGGTVGSLVIYILFFAGLIYFMMYRPQKKEKEKMQCYLHKKQKIKKR